MNYQYPFDGSWSKEEIVDVVHFFTMIENAYENRVNREELLAAYRTFKQIVPSKSEEKKLFAAFEEDSGYSGYQVIKKAKEADQVSIRMK